MFHYIITRRDLPLGDLAAQTIHAAGESAAAWAATSGQALPEHTTAIALAARDEAHLLDLASHLDQRGIQHILIREPDAPFNNAAMAIGLHPSPERAPIRAALSHLPLLR